MDVTKLVRDASKIHACLKKLPDNSLVTTKRLRIYIPIRFEERNLASIGSDVFIVGIYAIVTDDGFYGVAKTNAMIHITPSAINTVKVDGDDYYEFVFNPGSTVISNLSLVKNDVVTYYIFDEFFAKGRVPWYIDYDSLGSIFDSAAKHAGVNFGKNKVIIELIASIIARDKKDRYIMYRHVVKNLADKLKNKPDFIPLSAIQFTATNTVTKLAGAYMSDGIVSALVNPSERVERVESLLTR